MITTAKQIHEIAKTLPDYDYDNVGLRVQESDYGMIVGDKVSHFSQVWVDGDMTEELLEGICCIGASEAARRTLSFGAYSGNVILVLGSNRADSGEDDGELILWDAIILDIIRL